MLYVHLDDIPTTPHRRRAADSVRLRVSLVSSVRVPSHTADHKLTFDRLRGVHRGFIHGTYHKSIIDGHYMYHSEVTEMLTIPSP